MPARNANAERFVVNLNAAFSRRMDQAQMDLYTGKLSKWRCSEAVWARAMSLIVAECQYLPVLSEIYSYLKRADVRADTAAFQCFDLDGVRYARSVKPGSISQPPIGAVNVRLAVSHPARDEHEDIAAPAEARLAFLAGYEAAGGNPAKLALMLRASIAAPLLEREIADYDDSEDAL